MIAAAAPNGAAAAERGVMDGNRRGDGVLTWVALAVPGMTAGLGWAATDGWPTWNRVLAAAAVGLVIYAVIHFVIKGIRPNRR